MMRKLDERGMAALEFCFVAVPLFVLMFSIIDLGRYAITRQSLNMLANTGARKLMIACYTPAVTANGSPSGCTNINSYFSSTDRANAAPYLYGSGSPTVTMTATSASSALTVTASVSFTAMLPIWGSALDAPSASTAIPY